MKGRIYLSKNEYSEYDYMVEYDQDYDYCISINTNLDRSFESLISSCCDLDEFIDSEIELNMQFPFDNSEENIALLKKIKDKKEEFLINATYIEFNFDLDIVIKYIKDNPILKTKKIIFNETMGLNKNILEKLYLELNGDVDNLYFNLRDNTKLISFAQCMDTYRKLDEMVDKINRYNFSPLEKIMYVYDLVRNRVYLAADDKDDNSKSRDLSSVLLGDNIVCLGYTRIFNSLLERVGIKTREVLLLDATGSSGHARNEVYVKDDKYNIDGVYYFDATWDSKRKLDDNSYLSSYKYFAKTKEYMDEIDAGKFIDTKFPYFSCDIDYELRSTIEQKGFSSLSKDMIKSVNYMSSLIKGKYLIDAIIYSENSPFYGNIQVIEISEQLSELVEYFDKPIYADVLLEVLYNVRKVQYYQEPDKFPFSLDEFYEIMKLSKWGFKGNNAKERMLVAVFGEGISTKGHLIDYDSRKGLSKNIEGVKLTRTLRKIYDKKKD